MGKNYPPARHGTTRWNCETVARTEAAYARKCRKLADTESDPERRSRLLFSAECAEDNAVQFQSEARWYAERGL